MTGKLTEAQRAYLTPRLSTSPFVAFWEHDEDRAMIRSLLSDGIIEITDKAGPYPLTSWAALTPAGRAALEERDGQ